MTVEVAQEKKSLFGSLKGSKKEKKSKVPKEKKIKEKKAKNPAKDDDDTSVSSTGSYGKTWLGKEKKKPREEYQAEIDELKLKLAAVEGELSSKTMELQRFKNWANQAPRTY